MTAYTLTILAFRALAIVCGAMLCSLSWDSDQPVALIALAAGGMAGGAWVFWRAADAVEAANLGRRWTR